MLDLGGEALLAELLPLHDAAKSQRADSAGVVPLVEARRNRHARPAEPNGRQRAPDAAVVDNQ